jgi:hypothetical protein
MRSLYSPFTYVATLYFVRTAISIVAGHVGRGRPHYDNLARRLVFLFLWSHVRSLFYLRFHVPAKNAANPFLFTTNTINGKGRFAGGVSCISLPPIFD